MDLAPFLLGRRWARALTAFAIASSLTHRGSPAHAGATVSFTRAYHPVAPPPGVAATGFDAVAVADLDGANGPDIVVLETNGGEGAVGRVVVLLNRGDGTFDSPVGYDVCPGPHGLLVGQYNPGVDAYPDVIVACPGFLPSPYEVPSLARLLGDGAGHLGSPKVWSIARIGSHTPFLAQGNIDGDSIAWINELGNLAFVPVALLADDLANGVGAHEDAIYCPVHDGGGNLIGYCDFYGALTIAPYHSYPDQPGGNDEIFTFDPAHTGPSGWDISVVAYGLESTLSGWGTGGYRTGIGPSARIVVGDLDDDGQNDVVMAAMGVTPGSVAVYRPGFPIDDPGSPAPVAAPPNLDDVVLADVDGDGRLDLVTLRSVATNAGGKLGVQPGNGDGTFAAVQKFTTLAPNGADGVPQMVAADLNGDGRPDVVTFGDEHLNAHGNEINKHAVAVLVNTTPPSIASVEPNALGRRGTRSVALHGSGFHGDAVVSVSGTGVRVLSTSLVGPALLDVKLRAGASAALGARAVSLTSQAGSATCTGCLIVDPAPAPASAAPNAGARGTTENVDVFGSDFQSTAQVKLGSGITVNSTTFVSPTHLVANVSIAPTATTGARSLQVVNPDRGTGKCASCFSVT